MSTAPRKRTIVTSKAPKPSSPISQGVRVDSLVFTSGQLGKDPKTGKIVGESMAEQARQALENLKAVLKGGGASLDDVVKVTIFVTDLKKMDALNKVYREFFPSCIPARSCIEVSNLASGAKVEIEAIAAAP